MQLTLMKGEFWKFTFVVSFLFHNIVFAAYFISHNYKIYLLVSSAILGAISVLAWQKVIQSLKINRYIRICSRIYRYVYLFQLNYLLSSHFSSLEDRTTLVAAILFYGFLNFLKIGVLEYTRYTFFESERYKYYRDIINLERYFTLCFEEHNNLSNEDIIDHIRNNRTNLDSKTFFCLLCDNTEMNLLVDDFKRFYAFKQNNEICINRNISDVYATSREGKLIKKTAQIVNEDINEFSNSSGIFDEYDRHSSSNHYSEVFEEGNFEFNLNDSRADNSSMLSNSNNSNIDDCNVLNLTVEEFEGFSHLENIKMKGKITEESISRHFNKRSASDFFKILTQNFDDSLNFLDFNEYIRQFNNERTNLLMSLDNNEEILKTLKRVLSAVESVCLFVFLTFIFSSYEFLRVLLLAVSIFLIPVIINLIESFVFLVYMHPYDVGDRIYIEDDNLIVKRIGFTKTVFERWNNEYVVMPNRYIKNKIIKNIRRSKSQQWKIDFYASGKTKMSRVDRLRSNLEEFVENNKAFEHLTVLIDEIKDCSFFKLSFIVKHSINHQNGFFMWHVQNKFMIKLVHELKRNKISYLPVEILFED